MAESIEKKVADTLLQKSKEIIIGGANYSVAPPSTATLILVSEMIAEIPDIDVQKESDILSWSLRNAKDCCFIGDIVATLILGAKGITEEIEVIESKFFGFQKKKVIVTINHKELLSKKILQELTPKELSELAAKLFEGMEIGFFFQIITFLLEVNLTKRTKTETTVSGR